MLPPKPIAVLYEHPDWFRPLFAELDRRGIAFTELDAGALCFDPQDETPLPWRLAFNRASPSAYLRGRPQVTHATLAWLRHLERRGLPVVNGSATYSLEISKADQLGLLRSLGLPAPRSRVINHASQAVAAAAGLRFPVLVKSRKMVDIARKLNPGIGRCCGRRRKTAPPCCARKSSARSSSPRKNWPRAWPAMWPAA